MEKKKLEHVLKGNIVDDPPVWMMRQAGRYLPEYRKLREKEENFLKFCYNPQLTVEAALQPIRRYKFDAAIVFSDILLIPHAMGIPLFFSEALGPQLSTIDETFIFPNQVFVLKRLQAVFDSISLLQEKLLKEGFEDIALIGFCGAPWTLASYMLEGKTSRDFLKLRSFALNKEIFFSSLIDYLTEVLTGFLEKQIQSGAGVVMIFDSWAGISDQTQFESWITNPTKRIVANLKGKVPIIGFAKQAGTRIFSYAKTTKIDAVALDSSHDIDVVNKYLPKKFVVQGNLDPVKLLVGGTSMIKEIIRIQHLFSSRPFVFSLGHGILKQTPPENVALAVKTLRGGQL